MIGMNTFEEENSLKVRPEFAEAELRDKFLLLTAHCDQSAMAALFDRLAHLEDERELSWVAVPAATAGERKMAKAATA